MKRIIALLIVFLMIFSIVSFSATALSSPTPLSFYTVEVNINGTGGVNTNKWKVNIGDTITLVAHETDSIFVFWNIDGEYEIVDGDQQDKVLTIRPLSNLLIVANFENGISKKAYNNPSSTSPKTGQPPILVYIILLCMVIAAGGIICSKANLKVNKK